MRKQFTVEFLIELLKPHPYVTTVYDKMNAFHDNYTINCSAAFEHENKFYRFMYEQVFNPEEKKWGLEFCEAENGIMDCLEVLPIEKTVTKYVPNWD